MLVQKKKKKNFILTRYAAKYSLDITSGQCDSYIIYIL